MSEIQSGCVERGGAGIAFVNFVNGDAQAWMVVGRTAIVYIGSITRGRDACKESNEEGRELDHTMLGYNRSSL